MIRIAVLLILVSGYAYAQPVFINESFSDNYRAWPLSKGDNYTLTIEGGKYIVNTTQEGKGRVIRIYPYFEKRKDFSIEATFVQKSGSVNNGIGLVVVFRIAQKSDGTGIGTFQWRQLLYIHIRAMQHSANLGNYFR
jgi:hypothetical protein